MKCIDNIKETVLLEKYNFTYILNINIKVSIGEMNKFIMSNIFHTNINLINAYLNAIDGP